MATHYTTIGFDLRTVSDSAAFEKEVDRNGETIRTRKGSYVRLRSASGAELWLQLDKHGAVVGAQPHFSGEATTTLRVAHRLKVQPANSQDARLYSWINSDEYGEFPAVFDCANYYQFANVALPAEASVQIAAFAHELSVFASEDRYFASQPSEVKFASKAFGQPAVLANGTDEPFAVVSGHVRSSASKTNELTGAKFSWALLDSLLPLDLVIDSSLLAEPPAIGSILKGTFWLSGRIEQLTSVANPFRKLTWALRSTA